MSSSISPPSILSAFFSLCLFPILVTLALIFIPLAIFTTGLAASALTFRAALVYVELATALIWERLGSERGEKEAQRYQDEKRIAIRGGTVPLGKYASIQNSIKVQRHGNVPKIQPDSSQCHRTDSSPVFRRTVHANHLLCAQNNDSTLLRDYEGVGGWMSFEDPSTRKDKDKGGTDDSHLQWLRINSRLELHDPDPISIIQPKMSRRGSLVSIRRHKRSATAEPLGPLTALTSTSNIDLSSRDLHRSERPKSMILLGGSIRKYKPSSEYSDEQNTDSKLLGQPKGVEDCDRCDHNESTVLEQQKIRRQSNDSGSSKDGYAEGLTMLKR